MKKVETCEKDEIIHPLLNNGKKFKLTNWTFGKHKAVMRELAELDIKDNEIKNRKFENLVILNSLQEVGIDITEKDIDDFHPNDRIELYNKCYLAGRKGFKGDLSSFLPKNPKNKNQSSNE